MEPEAIRALAKQAFMPKGSTPDELAATRLASADVATSFEAWRLLRDDQRLTRPKAAAAMADAVTVLLSTHPAPAEETTR